MEHQAQNKTDTDKKPSRRKWSMAVIWVVSLFLILLLALYGLKILKERDHFVDVLGKIVKEDEILSRMRINLLKSVELEKNAVMAVTDKESLVFAGLSRNAADSVEKDRLELKVLIKTEGMGEEMKLFEEFNGCWENFRKIDEELLNFAVQNTNIKAANLSYTAGTKTIRRFEKALDDLNAIYLSAPEEARISKLSYQAVTAALKIHDLEAPHINEASDTQMDKIESIMRGEAEKIKTSLSSLSGLVDKRGRSSLEEADRVFKEFLSVNAEVLRLSRLNSNIKSMQLSLGRKRKVAAQCEEILSAMQEMSQKRTLKATR